jgi:cytoskeletal protein CcmA (bactofilin family)
MKYSSIMTCVICSMIFTAPGYALISRTGESVSIAAGEIIDDDIILLGQSIDVAGQVIGDVYAFGQTIKITGDVAGTVFTGGATITIDAQSVGTVIAAGGSIDILSYVKRNAVLTGGKVCVYERGEVGKDLRVYAGNLSVKGRIDGTLKGSVGKFVLSGKSGRVKMNVDQAKIESGAQITGDLILTAANDPVIEEGATITGEKKIVKPKEKEAGTWLAALAPVLALIFTLIKIVMFIARVIVGILLIALFRSYVRRIMDTMITKPWLSLGWGFLGVIVIPVAIVILFSILVGYPLGVLGAYVYSILWYLSSIFVALVIGEKVMQLFKKEGERSLYLSFIIGIVMLFVVSFIPILNFLVRIFTVLFGFGAIAIGSWRLIKEMREKGMV